MADASILEAPPAETDETQAIVDAVCETRAKGRSCPCPSYTELSGAELQVTSIHTGAFTAADRKEAVVGTLGCETGAASSSSYGSRMLVRHTDTGWKRVAYVAGALGQCTPIVSKAGIERLVCRLLAGHMGLYRETVSLLAWVETAGTTSERAQDIVDYWTVIEGDRPPTLTTTRFEVRGQEAYAKGDERALTIEMVVTSRGRTPPIALRFLFDGARFSIAPESRGALALLKRLGVEP